MCLRRTHGTQPVIDTHSRLGARVRQVQQQEGGQGGQEVYLRSHAGARLRQQLPRLSRLWNPQEYAIQQRSVPLNSLLRCHLCGNL